MYSTQWLFVSDVDATLLGDDEALKQLANALRSQRSTLYVALNSSRPCASLRKTMSAELVELAPDFLIGALGTEITRFTSDLFQHTTVANYRWRNFDWQREEIVQALVPLPLHAHDAEYQTVYKISYDIHGDLTASFIREHLKSHGLLAQVLITEDTKLDIIPVGAGKLSAITFLSTALNVPLKRVVVAGDSENDLDMFTPPIKGIVVANARPILRDLRNPYVYQAHKQYAAGVEEGLRFWNLIT